MLISGTTYTYCPILDFLKAAVSTTRDSALGTLFPPAINVLSFGKVVFPICSFYFSFIPRDFPQRTTQDTVLLGIHTESKNTSVWLLADDGNNARSRVILKEKALFVEETVPLSRSKY